MKIDSYKFIKYIFYILLIVSLLLSINSRVNALNYDYVKKGEWAAWPTTGNKKVLLSNYDSSLQSSNDSYTYRTTINFDSNRVLNNTSNYGFARFTIEGIDTQLLVQTNDFNVLKYYFRVQLKEDSGKGYSKCEVDDGYILCPLVKDGQYSALLFDNLKTMDIGQVYIHFMIWSPIDLINYIGQDDTQQIIDNNNQNANTINNSIQDTNNTLKDDDVSNNDSSDTISSIGNTFDTENDFLLGLLTIPYNFFNGLVNIFENNCTSLNLGSMFGEDLIFPCLSLSSLLGNVFTNVIDVIFCGVIMSAFLRRIVKYYQALLSLDERATQIGGVKIW